MSYQLELRHFKYFLAVADELHFRKAAEKLCISQPGLSRQIKQMEEIVATPLFLRNKKKVSLTPAGAYLKTEVEFILNHLEITQKQIQLIAAGNWVLGVCYANDSTRFIIEIKGKISSNKDKLRRVI